jgi:hypothetical protein
MLVAITSDENHRIFDDEAHRRAREAMHAIADRLTDQGLNILGQEWDEAHYLKATNAWGVMCDATIGANGTFTWDYRADATWTDPAQITAVAMTLLAADSPDAAAPWALRFPGQTFKSAVGLAARARGLHARLAEVIADPDLLEVSADVEPPGPKRGAVRVRYNVLRWECKLACTDADTTGLDVTEITEAIGWSVPRLQVLNARFTPSNQYGAGKSSLHARQVPAAGPTRVWPAEGGPSHRTLERPRPQRGMRLQQQPADPPLRHGQ